jgi:uncharacterized membrane protein YccC
MKPWLAAIMGGVVGAVVAVVVSQALWMRTLRTAIPTALQALQQKQEYVCTISLAALTRLEAGETDRAKFVLAREVASYYRHPLGAPAAQREKLLALIDEAGAKSPILKDELTKAKK